MDKKSYNSSVILCKDCVHSYDDLSGLVCSYGIYVDCVVPENFHCIMSRPKFETSVKELATNGR